MTRKIIEEHGGAITYTTSPAGTTFTVTLPAGAHMVVISANGYASVSDTIVLEPGRPGIFEPQLAPLPPAA